LFAAPFIHCGSDWAKVKKRKQPAMERVKESF